ncbi:MAG: hypothetical protein KGN84_05640 [Acidobacteriota bacterium]|nr:hypothetical protein [Acidobacteriota bacterium]
MVPSLHKRLLFAWLRVGVALLLSLPIAAPLFAGFTWAKGEKCEMPCCSKGDHCHRMRHSMPDGPQASGRQCMVDCGGFPLAMPGTGAVAMPAELLVLPPDDVSALPRHVARSAVKSLLPFSPFSPRPPPVD